MLVAFMSEAALQPATTKLAISSSKMSQISCQKRKVGIQVQDKLHKNVFISTCSFQWNNESTRS